MNNTPNENSDSDEDDADASLPLTTHMNINNDNNDNNNVPLRFYNEKFFNTPLHDFFLSNPSNSLQHLTLNPSPAGFNYSPISIACLNINGLSSPSKQSSLINLFRSKHVNILGLTETRLTKAAGNFMYKDQKDIYTVWSHHPGQSQRGGVGFMLSTDLAKHIQKVHLFKGRIISLDLFFKSFKLKVINLYFPVNAQSYLHERVETQMELDRLMQCAIKEQAACIIIGDMNIDPDRLTSSPNTSLLNLFHSKGYRESPILFNNQPVPTFCNNFGATSRIDHMWHSPHFPLDSDLLHKELLDPLDYGVNTDHLILLHYYALDRARSTMSTANLKQKGQQRTLILYNKATKEQWDLFTERTEAKFRLPLSELSARRTINEQWIHIQKALRDVTLKAAPADRIFEFKKVSNTHVDTLPNSLKMLRKDITFLDNILRKLSGSYILNRNSSLLITWYKLRPRILDLKSHYKWDDAYDFPHYLLLADDDYLQIMTTLKSKLRKFKDLLNARYDLEIQNYHNDSIQEFIQIRDKNFEEVPTKFITSALSHTKRSIVLDRVLVNHNNSIQLLTDS